MVEFDAVAQVQVAEAQLVGPAFDGPREEHRQLVDVGADPDFGLETLGPSIANDDAVALAAAQRMPSVHEVRGVAPTLRSV